MYFQQSRKRLWFARDPLGRRSLVWKTSNEQILVSSVGHKNISDLKEVPAAGVFSILLMDKNYGEKIRRMWIYI